jgi:hypothetical protein
MEQPEVDEFIYQFYNQIEPGHTAQYTIDVPQDDGTIREVLVQVDAKEYTAQEEKEKEEEAENNESCNSEDAEDEAEEATEQSKEETKEEVHKMQEAEKEQNPKYSTAKATWGDQMTKRSHKVFKGHEAKSIPDKHLKEVHKVEEILKHSIEGDDGGKSKSISPSKRLNMRAIVTESSENEYITKHGEEGKDIKINVIVDRSGSMHGRPSTESNILIAALNNLAFEYPELDVEIMLSETSNYFGFKLPVHNPDSPELWTYNGTGGSEGLARTFKANFDRMKNANVNLVYTDGDIYDEAIDKAYMQSQEIELVGMYVNEDFTEDEVMKYHEKNAKYFTHTIIRDNMLSLVNELANRIYLSKDGR